MEKIEWPELGPMELARGLGVCAEAECTGCPFDGETYPAPQCGHELSRQAAVMIGRLYDANEKAAEGLVRKLVDMAWEGNTALERGLEGVNHAKLAEMTGIQSELADLGRWSSVRTEPAGRQDGSMRIVEVTVEGRVVFSAEDTEKETVIANQSADWRTPGRPLLPLRGNSPSGDPVDHADRKPLEIATPVCALARNDMEEGAESDG